jgi:hypothetical protein
LRRSSPGGLSIALAPSASSSAISASRTSYCRSTKRTPAKLKIGAQSVKGGYNRRRFPDWSPLRQLSPTAIPSPSSQPRQ